MNTEPESVRIESSPLPAFAVRVGITGVSCLHLATVLAGLWLAVIASGQVLWTTVGFEVVALGAGVFGVLAGRGRIRDGYGLALLCIAGALIVSGVFGLHFAAGPTLRSATLSGEASASAVRVLGIVVKGRLVLGVLMAGLAALSVLTSARGAWKPLWVGVALLVPVGAVSIWLTRFGGAGRFVGDIESAMGVVRLIAMLFGGLVLFVIASIGAHFVIRAFDSPTGEGIQKSADKQRSAADSG